MEKTIWLHVKSGHFYVILDVGLREHDLEPEFEYKRLGEGNLPVGVKFHRPVREFLDGRFTQFQVNGVGGEVVDGARPAKRGKTEDSPALDQNKKVLHVGDLVFPGDEFLSWSQENKDQWHAVKVEDGAARIVSITSPDRISFEGDPGRIWHPSQFVIANPKPVEPIRAPLDIDGRRLEPGDWVEPVNLSKADSQKLVGQAPFRIDTIQDDGFPQIIFRGDKKRVGWYPAVFRWVDPDNLELE